MCRILIYGLNIYLIYDFKCNEVPIYIYILNDYTIVCFFKYLPTNALYQVGRVMQQFSRNGLSGRKCILVCALKILFLDYCNNFLISYIRYIIEKLQKTIENVWNSKNNNIIPIIAKSHFAMVYFCFKSNTKTLILIGTCTSTYRAGSRYMRARHLPRVALQQRQHF